ncbi:hypothetical protein T281_17710 [Rhodomicrobium udaipurense JA643]|nr:hypothetical protein T281_17710 [Rhodomicrobium udaipurense JA643]
MHQSQSDIAVSVVVVASGSSGSVTTVLSGNSAPNAARPGLSRSAASTRAGRVRPYLRQMSRSRVIPSPLIVTVSVMAAPFCYYRY